MENWRKIFKGLGWSLISIGIIDFLVALGNENFTVEVGYYYSRDEFSVALAWAYLINSTIPLVGGGVVSLFASDFISFVIEIYDKVCKIEDSSGTMEIMIAENINEKDHANE